MSRPGLYMMVFATMLFSCTGPTKHEIQQVKSEIERLRQEINNKQCAFDVLPELTK